MMAVRWGWVYGNDYPNLGLDLLAFLNRFSMDAPLLRKQRYLFSKKR